MRPDYLRSFAKIFGISIGFSFFMTFLLYHFAQETDFTNVPTKATPRDRFIALYFFNVSTQTTYGDTSIIPISNRARLYTSLYLIMFSAGILATLSFIFP